MHCLQGLFASDKGYNKNSNAVLDINSYPVLDNVMGTQQCRLTPCRATSVQYMINRFTLFAQHIRIIEGYARFTLELCEVYYDVQKCLTNDKPHEIQLTGTR